MASLHGVHTTGAVRGLIGASCILLTGCPFAMDDDFVVSQLDAGAVPPNPRASDAAIAPESGHPSGSDTGSDGATAPEGGGGCVPTSCPTLGLDCGLVADGCGHAMNCGTCTPPATCGGGGE